MRASGRDPGSTPAVKVRFLVVFLLDDGVVSGRKDTGMGGGWNRVRGGHEGLCEICNNNGHGHTGPDTMIFVVWSGDGRDLGRTGESRGKPVVDGWSVAGSVMVMAVFIGGDRR
ncbi:pollen-specific leucine-rich repeat extensin-like protein 3 [Iris pallida]|uniref:Pollen-specific leucine-rich repeat extensin-like protein 3 n=1 Tax=Iris pallida TaxID=29817 RepID=A0AAX6F9N2_IRIPA|nr:pollen-specific leucine-rich repeat extensin-like protein 3 [Iris pallida]